MREEGAGAHKGQDKGTVLLSCQGRTKEPSLCLAPFLCAPAPSSRICDKIRPSPSSLVSAGKKILAEAGVENAGRDAESLMCFVTGLDRQALFMSRDDEADDACRERFFSLIERRASGEPLQYITGEQWFMGYRFSVDPSVLIVRPETEILAEKAIGYLRSVRGQNGEGPANVLDLCTGTGAIATVIALECPGAKITASDISGEALATAENNARAHGVEGRISFVRSDLFEGLGPGPGFAGFDLIVTNPPYIRSDEIQSLQREIVEHEPVIALDGGADGLSFYRRIATEAAAFLKNDACVFAEIGHDQAEEAANIFKNAGFSGVSVFQDLAGIDRVITACRPPAICV